MRMVCNAREVSKCCALVPTHLLEQNVDVRVIQVLLGHTKLDTTARYTQVATNTIRNVTSPLDHLIGKIKKDEPPA